MKNLHKSSIISYLAEDMYNLVANIRSYPDFVPYCVDSDIITTSDNIVTAYIELSFHGIKKKFSTKNTMHPNNKITMKLIDGPLDFLEGCWEFKQVNNNSSKISLDISYTVSGFAYAGIFETAIGSVSEQILKSFIKRAQEIYG
jgi:ribosome-associated toxin RatA of RatAB toxin-antitoxin module